MGNAETQKDKNMGKNQKTKTPATNGLVKDPASESKELALSKTGAPPTINFAADAGAGLEGTGAESFAIPMLMVLQALSPQVTKASGKYIHGAEAGMFYESIGDVITPGDKGVLIVPCAYRRVYLRWSSDDKYRGELAPEVVSRGQVNGQFVDVKGRIYVADAAGKVDPEESDSLQDCRNHYILIVDPKTGDWRQALLSLRSTQIKKSRMLMTALAQIKVRVESGTIMPPTYANLVHATTVPESNDEGDWFGWSFKLQGLVDSAELYAAAKKFHQSITAGAVKVEVSEDALKEASATGF